MKKLIFFLFSFCLCMLSLNSCVKNNALPVFIEIKEWSLETNPAQQMATGDLSHNFDNAWVYVDEKLVGVFELPCKIPVLVEGSKGVRIYPTIRNNGLAGTKKIYPFVEPFETSADFVPGKTYTFVPKTRYYANVNFWVEDFESGTIKIETESSSTADLVRENLSSISEWGYYGHVALSESESNWTGLSFGQQYLPPGEEVYLEINYRNSVGISTALNAYTDADVLTERPNYLLVSQDAESMVWKKIYIDLKELVSYSTSASYFKQRLRASLGESQTAGDIYIDNIKVIHF